MAYPWEPWQIELLETQYGKMPMEALSEKIGKKKEAIAQYAHKHGISAGRFWTKEENEYLIKNVGYLTTARIAKNLGKTYRSVIDRRQKLKIGSYRENMEHLTLTDVAELVGRDKSTVRFTWFKNGLQWQRKGKYIVIKEENLCKFMKENPRYWKATECDRYFFRRYEWFEKRWKEESLQHHYEKWGKVI